VDVVTKALERMIDRGLLVGYGVRTKEKWFIREVRLTAEGRRAARKVAGEQQALPLKAST
jgi:DNA-binding MarR family transcriptional regulator